MRKQTVCTPEYLLPFSVYFLPFQVTPGWRVRHTARRPVQHLPQARWRCRRRQEQPKSARAICCEQVSANCLSRGSGGRVPALPEWKQISSFTPGLSRERASKLRNITGQAQNKRRAAGRSRQPNKCTFVKEKEPRCLS